MTTPLTQPPSITCLNDIFKKFRDIIRWCEFNPMHDHIFVLDDTFDCKRLDNLSTHYIAGSYPLSVILPFLKQHFSNIYTQNLNIDNNDIDLFILNSSVPGRNKLGDKFDVVFVPETQISDLLLGFDIPVCRAAFDFNGMLHISCQALYSLLTGKIILPLYLKDKKDLACIISNFVPNIESPDICDYLADRFHMRINKYVSRGFTIQWIETDIILKWLKERSVYACLRS